MSPETTHKLMRMYMEVLILGVIYFSTWFMAVSYRVYRVKPLCGRMCVCSPSLQEFNTGEVGLEETRLVVHDLSVLDGLVVQLCRNVCMCAG